MTNFGVGPQRMARWAIRGGFQQRVAGLWQVIWAWRRGARRRRAMDITSTHLGDHLRRDIGL